MKTSEEMACDVYPVYQEFCQTVSYAGYTWNSGCTDQIVGYGVDCSGGGGGSGSGSGGVSGDGGGGSANGAPTANPCAPTAPASPVGVESVNNGKRVLVVQPDPQPVGGGGSSGGGTGTGGSEPCGAYINQVITVDASISSNSRLNCIYNTIRNNSVFNALVSAFVGAGYNLKITTGSLAVDIVGKTQTDAAYTDPNVIIIINNDTQNYSLAQYIETFIHEAYHAHIDQVLIQQNRMGSQAFNSSYADSFDQYISYQMDSTKAAYNARNQAFSTNDAVLEQHNIISKDTQFIALGIEEAMERICPDIKNNSDVNWSTYLNYAWEGLQDSQAFKNRWPDDKNNPNADLHGSINLLNQFIGCP